MNSFSVQPLHVVCCRGTKFDSVFPIWDGIIVCKSVYQISTVSVLVACWFEEIENGPRGTLSHFFFRRQSLEMQHPIDTDTPVIEKSNGDPLRIEREELELCVFAKGIVQDLGEDLCGFIGIPLLSRLAFLWVE